jgi:hypothetical protein
MVPTFDFQPSTSPPSLVFAASAPIAALWKRCRRARQHRRQRLRRVNAPAPTAASRKR